MDKELVTNIFLSHCPEITPPPANWCVDGKIINKGFDQSGCQIPPECQNDCPEITPQPAGWCSGGKILRGKRDSRGCLTPDSCEPCPNYPPITCKDNEFAENTIGNDGCPLPPKCIVMPQSSPSLQVTPANKISDKATYEFSDPEGLFRKGPMPPRTLRIQLDKNCEGQATNVQIMAKALTESFVIIATIQPGETVDVKLTFANVILKALSSEGYYWSPRFQNVPYKSYGETPLVEVFGCGSF